MNQVKHNDRGFTLVELLIALSLLGLVISGGFSIYYFAHQSFVKSTVSSDIQRDMQLAMTQITNSLRTAHEASFFDTKIGPLPAAEDLDDGEIILLIYDGKPTMYKKPAPVAIVSLHPDYAQYEFVFRPVRDNGILLNNVVEIELKAAEYTLTTSVQLLNLRENIIEGNPGTDGANAFRYRAVFVPEDLDDIGDIEGPPSGCFIATAVYGSESAATNLLRRFRDQVLLSSSKGQTLVKIYYTYSPYAAVVLAKSWMLRLLVGTLLIPLILIAFICVHLRWIAAAALVAIVFGLGIGLVNHMQRGSV
ncbi:MAG TPA: prepilin-type N-terminal cleavage/methylation domain-containing protein [Firmicutes bacterium]|nr:prepilin-type N-terminal cleavage/methylation domain-containing protein [Bacillota bacterium]